MLRRLSGAKTFRDLRETGPWFGSWFPELPTSGYVYAWPEQRLVIGSRLDSHLLEASHKNTLRVISMWPVNVGIAWQKLHVESGVQQRPTWRDFFVWSLSSSLHCRTLAPAWKDLLCPTDLSLPCGILQRTDARPTGTSLWISVLSTLW